MKTENILVKDKNGQSKPAIMAVCPDCNNNKFMILVIDGHNHLQCSNCNTSFCQDGSCDKPPVILCPVCNQQMAVGGDEISGDVFCQCCNTKCNYDGTFADTYKDLVDLMNSARGRCACGEEH